MLILYKDKKLEKICNIHKETFKYFGGDKSLTKSF